MKQWCGRGHLVLTVSDMYIFFQTVCAIWLDAGTLIWLQSISALGRPFPLPSRVQRVFGRACVRLISRVVKCSVRGMIC